MFELMLCHDLIGLMLCHDLIGLGEIIYSYVVLVRAINQCYQLFLS